MKWDIDETHGVLWIGLEAAKALMNTMKNKVGISFKEHMVYGNHHVFKWCTLENENEKVGNFLVKKFKNKKFAEKFIKDYKNFEGSAIKTLNELDKTNFSKVSNDKLFDILKKATEFYI
ncbi:hypothetical protein KY331_04190 [Candidatus Woesearchaeota archaeon]|nr:hypothetical protein [Candidatus Woesearchaeota archaeon]